MKNAQPLIISILVLGATIQTEIIAKDTPTTKLTQQYSPEEALQKAFGQLQQIDTLVAQLALLVASGSIKGLSNPPATIRIFRDIRSIIGGLAKDQVAIMSMKNPELNQQLTAALTHVCDELILYLETSINNKLQQLKPFDIEQLTKRGFSKKPSSHIIKHNIKKIDHKIESLKHSIDTVGLTWYNKLARSFDKYIVTPANYYNVPTIAFYASGAAVIGAYTIWLYGEKLKKHEKTPNCIKSHTEFDKSNNPIEGTAPFSFNIFNVENLQRWFGKALPGHHTLNPTDEEKEILNNPHPYAVTELMIRETLLGTHPLISLPVAWYLKSFYEETWTRGIKPKLTEKRDEIWNFLRGGSFLQQAAPGVYSIEPKVNFDHMVGLDEVKKEFSTIIQYLDNPEGFANMKASPEKGWLLTGPKRTGKSFSFECLCGEIVRMQKQRGEKNKFTFWNVDASLIQEKGIKTILYYAQEEGPMVLFIDEIDLLDLNRVGNRQLLNEFLTAMQSSMDQDPSKVIIVIAATNKPQTLDPALLANGRFGKEIRFEYPAKKYRVEFITRELMSMALDTRQFDVERLAEKTDQRSFEDLRAIIRTAMTRAWRNQQPLTQELLEESIDTEMHHVIMTDRKELPENENRILASHFAGRAFATLYLLMNAKLDKVTIHARMTDLVEEAQWSDLYKDKEERDKQQKIEHGALTTRLPHDSIHAKNEELIINEAKALLAGFIAEELLLGSCGFTVHAREHEHAYKLIEKLIFGGIDPKLVSKNISEELKQKAFKLLQQCKQEMKQLLKDHQPALAAIADELMVKRILNDKQVQAIIDKAEGKVTSTEENVATPLTAEESELFEAEEADAADTEEEAILAAE